MKSLWKPMGEPPLSCFGCCGGDDLSNSGDEHPSPPARWSYAGPTGPDRWGDLDPSYEAAKTGRRQSPIDLSGRFLGGAPTVFFSYQCSPLTVTNNGHSIQVSCPPGSSISVGGRRYELLQYHFHTPSEHTVDGRSYEMEMHLVHKDRDDQLAVVGIFMTGGDSSPAIGEIWKCMPQHAGQSVSDDLMVDPTDLLPGDRRSVHYEGSLTTPPCTENVAWIMLLESIPVSSEQIRKFEQIIGPSNRPIQPLNDRVLRSGW